VEEEGICSNCAKNLNSTVKLRNRLTHRYWKIDGKQIYNSIRDDFRVVDKFLRSVQEKYAINAYFSL
jgi:uncharacterized protein YutE (UPF0331/DUF86 family)